MKILLTQLLSKATSIKFKHLVFFLKYLVSKATGDKYIKSTYGVYLHENWEDATFRYCIIGSYGNTLQKVLSSYNKEFVFLDIGANQGLYSLIAAKNVHCNKAIAFEPVPETCELLTKNVSNSQDSGKITVVMSAISATAGTGEISIHNQHSGAASLRTGDNSSIDSKQRINLITSSEVAKLVPLDKDIVVKVDVEGHESIVMQQLVNSSFINEITCIFYEVDEKWVDANHLESSLRDVGFSSFTMHGKPPHYDVLATRS